MSIDDGYENYADVLEITSSLLLTADYLGYVQNFIAIDIIINFTTETTETDRLLKICQIYFWRDKI